MAEDTAVIVAVLLALGSPFLRVAWGGTDATVLPTSAAPRVVTEALSRDFPGNPTAPIEALVRFNGPVKGSPARSGDLNSYVARLSRVGGVASAQVTGIDGDVARVDLGYAPGPNTTAAEAIVAHVRQVAAPAGSEVFVGGQTAELVDTLASLSHTLPAMLLVILATFVMLFLAFGSVILPLKAILMNILSLSVMYGVIVWVFQEGHLSGLLHFTADGTINPTTPIPLFAIMFGLSMDYEVFLLSRIREHYVATGDNTASIATGLQRTGGIITSAALLLIVVIGPFALSGVTFTKMMGVGMIVALVIDATVIRMLLVPSTMRLLGHANWWAPAPLRRLAARIGLQEGGESGPVAVPSVPVLEPAAA
jgi:trehalose monomycolate/heme transporter